MLLEHTYTVDLSRFTHLSDILTKNNHKFQSQWAGLVKSGFSNVISTQKRATSKRQGMSISPVKTIREEMMSLRKQFLDEMIITTTTTIPTN